MKNQEEVMDMFNRNKSAYAIHMETGLSFKEIAHYISVDEQARQRHKNIIRAKREQDANT